MSSKPEPVIWSHNTGQQIPCFDSCQLTIAWMFNIKDTRCKPRLQDLVLTRVRPPCCAASSLGACARDPCLPREKSCMGHHHHHHHEFLFLCISISMHACDPPVPITVVMGLRSANITYTCCGLIFFWFIFFKPV